MELALCTDVLGDLSYPDMLDKVKSLGIMAVEMTAGGWGGRKHVNTQELLNDEGKRKTFLEELTKRGMRISALNTSCNPTWPSETGKQYSESMYDWRRTGRETGSEKTGGHGRTARGKSRGYNPKLDHIHNFLARFHGSRL